MLLTSVYRLDSATDFALDWTEQKPSSFMVLNYVAAYIHAARDYAAAGDLKNVRRMLEGAVGILRVRRGLVVGSGGDQLPALLEYWQSIDPGNPEVEKLRRELLH